MMLNVKAPVIVMAREVQHFISVVVFLFWLIQLGKSSDSYLLTAEEKQFIKTVISTFQDFHGSNRYLESIWYPKLPYHVNTLRML